MGSTHPTGSQGHTGYERREEALGSNKVRRWMQATSVHHRKKPSLSVRLQAFYTYGTVTTMTEVRILA